jgi:hypothetical protein
MKLFLFFIPILFAFFVSCKFDNDKTGLHDDFTSAGGWWEINSSGDSVPPVVKMETEDGALKIHHKFRTLEFAAEKHSWIESTVDTSTNMYKNYGVIDLDKYHFVVLNVKEKGASSYFYINGFRTKLGYTTGITVIDLKDYDNDRISGTKRVTFGIDMQDNHTHLTLEDLKFVSELSKKEKDKLIGAGLTIHDENLDPRPYHGLEALKYREDIPLPKVEGEEMVVFRDDATGAITTRLTSTPGDDYFGEGGIWSGDGAAIKFESSRKMSGIPVCIPGEGRVIAGPKGAAWRMWSEKNPDILYLMKRDGRQFSVLSWNKSTGNEELIAEFSTPEYTRTYVEFKRFTPQGNIVVAFRETPYLYIIDINNKKARFVELPTRLKDPGVSGKDNIVTWANCYTYEKWWLNIDTGEKGRAPGFSSGHASHGANGMVANFGGHLNVFVPGDIGRTFTPGDKIQPWANWKNNIVTDYGRLTIDNKFVFTNGRKDDVDHQHLMISSEDPGAVMRVARYFTKFSWTSTTYSRPSPDYTKLVYNENMMGSTELHMVYTRRPDAPVNVNLEGESLSWDQPKRNLEIAGYHLYGSNNSGRGFTRISKQPLRENQTKVNRQWKYYAVASVEHSGLESLFSNEVSIERAQSFYFEAEEMEMTPPARRFFDGYANGFQTVRINAQSHEESVTKGKIAIPLKDVPEGEYFIWGRVKGKGNWTVAGKESPIDAKDWEWVKMDQFIVNGSADFLDLTSSDDVLKLDIVLLTTDYFVPEAVYPADGKAPGKVQNGKAVANGNQVHLSWEHSDATDLHHYSVYCGKSADFPCNNETVIRSVLKNSITDVLPEKPKGLFYKVIAVDNRWNESEAATILVN